MPTLLLLAAVGLLCALFLPTRLRSRRARHAVPEAEPEPAAPPPARRRRRPMRPPPTFGRWDETPTVALPPTPSPEPEPEPAEAVYEVPGRPSS